MCPLLPGPATPVSDRARALHATLRVADLHADSLLFGRDLLRRGDRGHVDVPRLIEGRVALQVLSMAVKTPRGLNIDRNDDSSDEILTLALAKRWPPSTWRRLLPRVLYLAGRAHGFAAASGGTFRVIETRADLVAYLADHAANPRITAGLLSIEGAHALDGDPANVDVVADAGIRMISPAHFFDTAFGGSAHGIEQHGLTAKGREMVRRMEARGVAARRRPQLRPDHRRRAGRLAPGPVVASHTGVRGVLDNARNLSDAHLDGIAATRRPRGDRVLADGIGRRGRRGHRPLDRLRGGPRRSRARGPGLRLGRRRARSRSTRRTPSSSRRAAGRGPRRGRDPGGDGRERPAGAGGDAARGLSRDPRGPVPSGHANHRTNRPQPERPPRPAGRDVRQDRRRLRLEGHAREPGPRVGARRCQVHPDGDGRRRQQGPPRSG